MMKPTGVSTAFAWRGAGDATDAVQLVPEGERVRLISVAVCPFADYDGDDGITYVIFKNGGSSSTEELFQTIAAGQNPFFTPVITLPGTGIVFDDGIYMTCDTGVSTVQGVIGVTINYQGMKDGDLAT